LNPREPQPLELAALGGLAGFRESEVAPLLLEAYRSATPVVRGEVVQALLARVDGTIVLLEAIESGAASAADVPPARKTLLAAHANPAIREKAEILFGGETTAARSDAIAAYRDVLATAGDATRGQTVAKRECLICHRLGNNGQDVGPNLLAVRHRSAEELLTHILDPNREVAPNFVEYVVSRTDGRVATGIVATETATSITLVRAEGQTETILRGDIEAIGATGRSLMPEGLEKRISKVEMADLLAHLKGAN
jgi:putative heme-binding domain-containing protein